MQEPALEISTMFRRVTNDVWDSTKGRQRPEYSSTLRSDYYLDPVADRRIWERVRDLNDAAAINEFIAQFPYSAFVPEAQHRLELLQRSRREREEQARLERERFESERVRREACQRESQELALIGDDLARLLGFAQRTTCDEARNTAHERIKSATAALEERARRDEARRRDEEERLKAERCRIEAATVDALRHDLAKLRDLAERATCDQARAVANRRSARCSRSAKQMSASVKPPSASAATSSRRWPVFGATSRSFRRLPSRRAASRSASRQRSERRRWPPSARPRS